MARPLVRRLRGAFNPNLKRPFGSVAQMAEEQREVRVWGGIHYRNSLVVGDEMGRKIAAYLVAIP
jgi:hypothetical protein